MTKVVNKLSCKLPEVVPVLPAVPAYTNCKKPHVLDHNCHFSAILMCQKVCILWILSSLRNKIWWWRRNFISLNNTIKNLFHLPLLAHDRNECEAIIQVSRTVDIYFLYVKNYYCTMTVLAKDTGAFAHSVVEFCTDNSGRATMIQVFNKGLPPVGSNK